MAKKTTKIVKKEENEMDFDELCQNFRTAKIAEDKAKKEKDKLSSLIKDYAIKNNLKGDINGIKIVNRYTFASEENLELAKKLGIEVPTSSSMSLDFPKQRLEEIADSLGLSKDLIQTTPKLKELEEIFKKNNIQANYILNVAVGLSAKE